MDKNGYNQSIYPLGECFVCGAQGTLIRHEIFGGPNRQKSKMLGLWLNLCPHCHLWVHREPRRFLWLKEDAQVRFCELNNWSAEEFILEFGRSYV